MKKILIGTIISAVVMFGLAAVIWLLMEVNIEAAWFAFLIRMYIINPLFMVFIGIYIGKLFGRLWFVPIIPVAFHIAVMLISANISVDLLLFQPLSYLAIGEIAALLTFLYNKSKVKSKGKNNGKD